MEVPIHVRQIAKKWRCPMKQRIALIALAALVIGTAYMTGLTTAQGSRRPSATDRGGLQTETHQAPVHATLGALRRSMTVTDTNVYANFSSVFVDVPGASITSRCPEGGTCGFHVTFSATCAIDGQGLEEDLAVQALVDGVVIQPGDTTLCEDFETDNNAIPEGGHALQWVVEGLASGVAHVIKIQWRTDDGAEGFLRDFNLTVRQHEDV
jgi:hypothetical protein